MLNKIYYLIPNKMRWKVYVILFFLLLITLLELLSIGLIFPFISLIIEPKSLSFFGNDINFEKYISNYSREKILLYGLILFNFLIILKNLILFIMNYLSARFYLSLNVELISTFFKKYMSQDYLYHVYSDSSFILRNILSETTFLAKKNLKILLDLILSFTILIGLTIMLLYIRPKETIVILSIFLIFFIIYNFSFKKTLERLGKKRLEYDGLILKYTQQALRGFREIKLYHQENFFEKILIKKVFRRENIVKFINIITPIPRYIIEIFIILILTFVALNVLKNDQNLQNIIPEIALLAAIAIKFFPLLNKLIINSQGLRYGYASVDRLWEENKLKILSKNNSNENEINFEKYISFQKMSFKYPNSNNFILEDIDLKFLKGNVVGIQGSSGQGKSTFLDLISGIIEPTSGGIKIDNKDISLNSDMWRKKIGYVSQHSFFLDDTLKNNIIFDKLGIVNEDNFAKSLKLSNVDEFIKDLPMGIDTIIGEDGAKLSGGQKQRISIARAIYRNPEIIIFDEATSALDESNEKKIFEVISNLKGHVTIFISTHKISLLSNCDIRLKIQDKKITSVNS